MNDVLTDFNRRCSEVEGYLNFVKVITNDIDDSQISYISANTGVSETYEVTDQLQKVLIANGFLLLYNLVEATMRNSIAEIFDKVSDEETDYGKLSEKLKDIWLSQSTSNLRQNFRSETLFETVQSIANSVLTEDNILLDKAKFDFSGNLDARKIRELASKYGFDQTSMNAENLVTIKRKRNHLAHGNFSFSDIGKDFTITEISLYRDETVSFLSDVIQKIEDYINSKKYLAADTSSPAV